MDGWITDSRSSSSSSNWKGDVYRPNGSQRYAIDPWFVCMADDQLGQLITKANWGGKAYFDAHARGISITQLQEAVRYRRWL